MRDVSDEYALLAVQGPRALERLGLPQAKAFTWAMGELDGVEVMVNRTGYTGEEGVELGCMADDAGAVGRDPRARRRAVRARRARHAAARGLLPAARQRHRPESDAISAGLGWACALDKDFTGVERLREIKAAGPERQARRVPMTEKAIPRHGMAIEGGGEVTSGTHSPMLDVGIGMATCRPRAAPGTELTIDVRGKPRSAEVVKKPIYKKEE